LKKTVGYLLTIVITFSFLYIALKNVDLKKTISIISHASIPAILLYVFIFFTAHFVRALRWKFMINSIKKDVSIINLFGSVMVSYGVSCIIPRLGELYRGLFLGRWENISRTTVIGTIVIERIIDVAAFAFAALISVYIYSGNLYDKVLWLKTSLITGFVLVFVMIFFLIFIVRYKGKFNESILRMIGKISPNLAAKLKNIFDTLITGLSSIIGIRNIISILFLSVLLLALYAANAYVGFYVLGMGNNVAVSYGMSWVVMTISAFGVMIPTPGGTGSYHLISIFALTQLFAFDYETSAAYAIFTHLISYVLSILSAVMMIYLINWQRGRKGLKRENIFSVFSIKSGDK
jgi:uncharacterized protein (TIRG00374 family)